MAIRNVSLVAIELYSTILFAGTSMGITGYSLRFPALLQHCKSLFAPVLGTNSRAHGALRGLDNPPRSDNLPGPRPLQQTVVIPPRQARGGGNVHARSSSSCRGGHAAGRGGAAAMTFRCGNE